MQQLTFEAAGEYAWRDAPDPEITSPEQAVVRPLAVACCDLDVAVAEGRLPMPPGHAVGHEGVAEVVAVGDAVRAAHLLTPQYPDGQVFLDLHGHTAGHRPVESTDALYRLLGALGVSDDRIPHEVDDRSALWRAELAGSGHPAC